MVDNYIYRICPECKGDGIVNRMAKTNGDDVEADEPCENCQDGLFLWGVIKDELISEE